MAVLLAEEVEQTRDLIRRLRLNLETTRGLMRWLHVHVAELKQTHAEQRALRQDLRNDYR
jgi:hypothetical protein